MSEGKSRKQKHKREDEARSEIAGRIFEKRKERRARSAHCIASMQNQTSILRSLYALLGIKTEKIMSSQAYDVLFKVLRGI